MRKKTLTSKKVKKVSKKKVEKVVAVSGGFDPLHIGHLQMFENAKKLGSKLIVILNNDHWLRKKKGYAFLPQDQRKAIIEALKPVDEVYITEHEPDTNDMSVSVALKKVKPHIFANGGDRHLHNVPEIDACVEIDCEMVYNIGGGKVESSSWLLNTFYENYGTLQKKKVK